MFLTVSQNWVSESESTLLLGAEEEEEEGERSSGTEQRDQKDSRVKNCKDFFPRIAERVHSCISLLK